MQANYIIYFSTLSKEQKSKELLIILAFLIIFSLTISLITFFKQKYSK